MLDQQDEIVFKVEASPFFWREKARELKFASEIIWPYTENWLNKMTETDLENLDIDNIEPDTFSIYLSLIGFSTEALFKGVIIRDNPEFISKGKLSSKLTIHNLIELSKLAKLSLSQNERIFCEQAYEAMVVKSRYPVAKSIKKSNGLMEIGGHCKEVFAGLYDRLYPTLGQFYNTKTTWREM